MRKNGRKLLSLLLALIMVLGMLPMSAFAASSDFTIDDGVLTKYNGSGGDVTIPEGVTSIGEGAFWGCKGLTSVTISEGVTYIGFGAFLGCTGLTSVTIPNSVTNIAPRAFNGCTGLTSVTIPEGVTSIEVGTFWGCTGLTSVTIPNTVTGIKGAAFADCTGLTGVTIPESVTNIGDWAFQDCTGLTNVTISGSVTSIGKAAFSGCTGLKDVYYGGSETRWKAIEIDYDNNPLTSATIHYNSTGPDQSTTPDQPSNLPTSDFTIEDGVLTKYNGPGGAVTIPDGVTSIGEDAFKDCTGLTSVTIPNSVTRIGNAAFRDCTGLTSVTIPESVTSIGSSAFYSCTGLTSVTIPNSVTNIGENVFDGCTGLTSVTIPESITSIGKSMFLRCTGLTSITISDGVTSIGMFAFAQCENLTSVTIPNSVTSIGMFAFGLCQNLTSITIPGSVTSISTAAFGRCYSLTDVYYGGSEAQWKAIEISYNRMDGFDNNSLTSATIHYNSTAPNQSTTSDQPSNLPAVEDIPAAGTAAARTQAVKLDGRDVEFQCYALHDANGNPTNYVKLRDLALALNNTRAQFNVSWDGKISIASNTPYQIVGGEGSTPYSGNQSYKAVSNTPVSFNGREVKLTSFSITYQGGGYTYYKLRDLGQLLNFNVKWDGGVVIETDKPYTGK